MTPDLPVVLQELAYEEEAREYLRSLPLEHFMEATDQATQRAITLASLELLHARRPDVHVFNELLIQYPLRGRKKLGKVVPDNMVVLTTEPIRARSSFNVPLEPAPPFWVMEYVSKGNPRKDYKDSFRKYERHLKVPYYLLFHPEAQKLTLYRHTKGKYEATRPNRQGRYPVRKLDLEVGLLDGWVRYWHEGNLLPLPAELQRELDAARQRADEERQRADEEKQRADEERQRADEEKQRADELQKRLEEAEQELAKLRAHRGQQ